MLLFHLICSVITIGWLYAFFRTIRAMIRKKYELHPHGPKGDEKISVSIIIPARNEERNIRSCVLSALQQEHKSVQVIVLDDASDDSTPTILDTLQKEYPELIIEKGTGAPLPEGWFGKPWALERAQKQATGTWLLFVDADDSATRSMGESRNDTDRGNLDWDGPGVPAGRAADGSVLCRPASMYTSGYDALAMHAESTDSS